MYDSKLRRERKNRPLYMIKGAAHPAGMNRQYKMKQIIGQFFYERFSSLFFQQIFRQNFLRPDDVIVRTIAHAEHMIPVLRCELF